MAVDHRGLNAFLNVARLGSVGAAATALSLTQPAVSRTLRKLEQQLGVQLFLRHSTGMELTAFGQSLLPHAALLETGLHRALEEIDLLRGASKGMARVGILPSLVPDILPTVLQQRADEAAGNPIACGGGAQPSADTGAAPRRNRLCHCGRASRTSPKKTSG